MVTCTACKGKGTYPLVAKMYDGGTVKDMPPVDMPCDPCEGKGVITKERKLHLEAKEKAFKEFWCQCGNPSGESTFFDDGEGSMCNKHHYICNDCHKVTQVG